VLAVVTCIVTKAMHFFADMSSSNLVISLVRPPQFELFVLDRRLGGGRGWLWVERYFLPVIHFIFIKSGFPGPSSNKIYGKKPRYNEILL